MKNRLFVTLLTCITISVPALTSCNKQEVAKPVVLTISGGRSLQKSLLEIKDIYHQQKPNVTIVYKFGPSGSNKKAIEQGAAIDIFISNNNKAMNDLQSKGFLLPETRKKFISNQIVLLTGKNTTWVSDFKDLSNTKIKKISLNDPKKTGSGTYTEQVLKYLVILNQLKEKFVYLPSSVDVVNSIENGTTDAGVAFATDAILSNKVKVAAIAPEKSHDPIVYTLVVLKNSKNISEAKEFAQFLVSDPAGSAFVKYGFILNTADKTK